MNSPIKIDIETDFSRLHLASLDELSQSVGSSKEGLTNKEVIERQGKYGPNELRVKQDTPAYIRFLKQFANFFAILLMVGGALALVAEQLDPGQGNLYIASALFGVVLLNALFTFIQEYQSEKIMDSFREMMPSTVRVRRDQLVHEVEASELVPGDVILLAEGDKIPADGRLLQSSELKVDMSSLTGESEAVLLDCTSHHKNLLESRNMVFSGSLVQSGNGEVLICSTGMDTQIGKIVQLTKEADTVETPIRKELQHFIKIIGTIAISLGTLFFLVSIGIGKGSIGSLIFAIGIIVANVPEGLLPTVTLALTMASKRMAKKNALIKNLESVETLGSTTVICTDKTGTLTQNRISVHRIVTPDTTYSFGLGNVLAGRELKNLRRIMALCNNAQLTGSGFIGDPTEAALLACVRDIGEIEDLSPCERINEQPFTSATKYMVSLNQSPDGDFSEAYLKGAPEVVFGFCDKVLMNGELVERNAETDNWFKTTLNEMAGSGERCLGFAYQPTQGKDCPGDGYIFVGIAGMLDPPRPEVPDALAKCHRAGIRVFMLTGDFGLTAKTIAEKIGLITDGGRVVQGDELSAMDEQTLSRVLDEKELVFARISPEQKLQIVKALQKKGEVVTVTGDGVNDAPALKNADMGVAMGIQGTDVAKEASNMVLMDDNFATIVSAVEEGRTIFENIKKFIAYILTSNIPQILPFIAFVLLDVPLPLTVVLILAIDLGTDILPALGLGAEKPETDVMKKPPRARSERLLTGNLLFMSYGIIGMIQAAAGFYAYFTVLYSNGWQWGQQLTADDPVYRTAITAFFASIIICQIADVLICRTRRQSIFTVGIFANKLVWMGIATELVLLAAISYIPAFNTFFGTAPLELWHFALSVPFALAIIIGDEIRRIFVRRENAFVLRWLSW
ncbi:ATPase [Gammaproteobacteria bacterium 50_400_T64]|nr:ATPase [Gammaproteobacteria bacterium 50_400_T64]